jgi:hypothetical protein
VNIACIVLVVYMARDVMISMRANPLLGPLEGVGPGNLGFFLAQMALAEDMKTKAKKEKS